MGETSSERIAEFIRHGRRVFDLAEIANDAGDPGRAAEHLSEGARELATLWNEYNADGEKLLASLEADSRPREETFFERWGHRPARIVLVLGVLWLGYLVAHAALSGPEHPFFSHAHFGWAVVATVTLVTVARLLRPTRERPID